MSLSFCFLCMIFLHRFPARFGLEAHCRSGFMVKSCYHGNIPKVLLNYSFIGPDPPSPLRACDSLPSTPPYLFIARSDPSISLLSYRSSTATKKSSFRQPSPLFFHCVTLREIFHLIRNVLRQATAAGSCHRLFQDIEDRGRGVFVHLSSRKEKESVRGDDPASLLY